MEKKYLRRAMMNADGFMAAANGLWMSIAADGTKIGKYGPAYTVNLAFACEIYLKQLVSYKNQKYQRGHKLVELFGMIEPSIKRDIENKYAIRCDEYKDKVNPNAQLRGLNKCLQDYNSAFEDWRYYFEPGGKIGKCLGWIDFQIFIEILAEEIYETMDLSE